MRRTASMLAIAAIGLLVLAPAIADARPGGNSSSGSRGSRTYSAPPATNTAPQPAQPMQRTQQPAGSGPSRLEVERLSDHFEERLEMAGFFYPPEKAAHMKLNMRNMFARLGLTRAEVQTFHGMLRQIAYKLRKQGE